MTNYTKWQTEGFFFGVDNDMVKAFLSTMKELNGWGGIVDGVGDRKKCKYLK